MMNPTDKASGEITFVEQNAGSHAVGIVGLNNPRALNALTLAMFEALERKLLEWRERAGIASVVLHADSDKAYCAGDDVKALVAALPSDSSVEAAADFFLHEYFVDYLIHVYSKPILCWADGIAMGGGIGIMNGASSRVVTERTMMAMPLPSAWRTYSFGLTRKPRSWPACLTYGRMRMGRKTNRRSALTWRNLLKPSP